MLRNWFRLALIAYGINAAAVAVGSSGGQAQNGQFGPRYGYTGFYLGVSGGIAASKVDWSNPVDGFLGTSNMGGVMYGANFGYNFQFGQFVAGVEVSGTWTSLHGDYEKFGWRFDGRVQSYETLTGRVGFLSGEDGSALYYMRGGAVWAQYRYTSDWPEIFTFFEANKTLTGAAVGIGYERSLWNHWRLRAEYMRLDFGSSSIDLTPNRAGVNPYRVDVGRFGVNSISLGLNYQIPDPNAWSTVFRTQRNFPQ